MLSDSHNNQLEFHFCCLVLFPVTGTKRRLFGASDTAEFHDQPPPKIKPASTSAKFVPLASSTPQKVSVINEADGVNKSHPKDKDVNPATAPAVTTVMAKEPIVRNDEIGNQMEWIIIDDSSDSDTEHIRPKGKSAPNDKRERPVSKTNGNSAITSSSKSTAKTTVFKGLSDVIGKSSSSMCETQFSSFSFFTMIQNRSLQLCNHIH